MRHSYFICLFVLLGCGSGDKSNKIQAIAETDDASRQITCWGIGDVQLDLDEKMLKDQLGAEHVTKDSVFFNGKYKVTISRAYRGAANELTVFWKETHEPLSTIDSLEISGKKSDYKFSNGITLGTTLSELQSLNNGAEIALNYLPSTNTLFIKSVGEGKLKGDMPCFSGELALPDSIPASSIGELKASRDLKSSNPIFKSFEPRLQVIRIRNI